MWTLLIDTLLPGDFLLGLPAASKTALLHLDRSHRFKNKLNNYLTILQDMAQKDFCQNWDMLNDVNRLTCIEKSRRTDPALSTDILIECLNGYYSSLGVLTAIGAGAAPPFPAGNVLPADDWSILEPVYIREPTYRRIA